MCIVAAIRAANYLFQQRDFPFSTIFATIGTALTKYCCRGCQYSSCRAGDFILRPLFITLFMALYKSDYIIATRPKDTFHESNFASKSQ